MKSDLKTVTPFTDITNLNKEYTSVEMASLFNKDKETIDNLYLFYTMNSNLTNKLTINEFTTFVINNVLPDSRYNSSLDSSTINKLYLLNNFEVLLASLLFAHHILNHILLFPYTSPLKSFNF